MVGGAILHRIVIQRESSALTPQPLFRRTTKQRRWRAAQDNYVLDKAFVLIEGHPPQMRDANLG